MKKLLFTTLILFAGFSFATAQVNLSFNPKEDTKYEYKMEITQNMKQTAMGYEIPMTHKTVSAFDMAVQEKSAAGTKINFVYTEIVYDLSSTMMNIKYDSKKPSDDTSQVDVMMGKMFGSIIGKSFQAVIAPDGSVISVSGFNAIVEDLIKNMGDDSQSQMFEQALEQQFSDEAIKTMLEQYMKIYPGKTIKKGDSWIVKQNTDAMGMTMAVKSTYRLKSVDKKVALTDVTSTIDGMDGAITGTQQGTVEFDVETGLVKMSIINQKMKGTMSANGIDIDIDMDSKATVTTTEKSN